MPIKHSCGDVICVHLNGKFEELITMVKSMVFIGYSHNIIIDIAFSTQNMPVICNSY